MLDVGLNEDAGRTACLAGFHVAQALIFEHRGRAVKTHRGVRTEFLSRTRDDARVDEERREFLGRTHNPKSAADYDTGPRSAVPIERARDAVAAARRFVETVAGLV